MSHWLLSVAERAQLPNASTLAIPPDMALEDAWKRVAAGCALSDTELARCVALVNRCDLADWNAADDRAPKLLPASVAQRYGVFPLREDNRRIVVAASNPTDLDAEQQVRFASGRTPVMQVAPPAAIAERIRQYYTGDRAVRTFLHQVAPPGPDDKPAAATTAAPPRAPAPAAAPVAEDEDSQSGPVVRLGQLILEGAIAQGASDIHIQATPSGGVVRFRVDGMLRHFMHVPPEVMSRLVSRIKVLGNMNISDRLRPQDGHATVSLNGTHYDLRISTVPTRTQEKAVIRVLGTVGARSLDQTGMRERDVRQFRDLLRAKEGIVIVTGPTGSGKTTTLYSALHELATEEVNIMSVEDPVEYELPGLTQIQVEARQGVTFAAALRAILRQDPDIIFVGEIRDEETAAMAVQASRTGHLVLTTLHTNDAIGCMQRLTDLGLAGADIVDTLRGALGQRLVRRLCTVCATAATPETLPAAELALSALTGVVPPLKAVGCDKCGQTGFKGRAPIVQICAMTPKLAAMIQQKAGSTHLRLAAQAAGMITLREAALERVREGLTTLEEADRVVNLAAGMADVALEPVATSPAPADGDERGHVLLVDDDRTVRMLSRVLLEQIGWRVSEADDGQMALERLRTEMPDLMVLDLDMPRMGGRDVLATIRRAPDTSALPVIVLTGVQDESAEAELMQGGADDYIRKPIDPPGFIARIKALSRRASG